MIQRQRRPFVCLVIAAICSWNATSRAEPRSGVEWEKGNEGETAFVPMKSAPFPHPSRDKGYNYGKKEFPREPHYTDSTVGLFVPRGFHRTGKVNVLIYLHGWNNNVRKAMSEFKLREQIIASGQNVVLIFPEGPRDASDSGCGKLEDQDGLKHLIEESLAVLHASGKIEREELGEVWVAGHSGAYRGLACCADHGGCDKELTNICLLDASYGNLDMFVNWAEKHPKGQLFSIFTDHLSAQNVYLFTHVQKFDENSAMRIDSNVQDDLLANSRTLFLHTEKLKHDETVQWLKRWLQTRKLN